MQERDWTTADSLETTDGRHFQVQREAIVWPNKARIALTWTVVFELLTSTSKHFSTANVINSVYGGRRGIWRILDQLDAYGVRASIFVNGAAGEKFPQAVKEAAARGHEIVPYGYASNFYLEELNAQQEREHILKTIKIIGDLTGSKPRGWASPEYRPGPNTLSILAEQGIVWNGDFPNDDVPYSCKVGGKKLVIIPYQLESDSREIYERHRHHPDVWVDCFKRSFDTLYEEGAESPKMLNATLHAYLARSLWMKALESTIQHARQFSDVWYATRDEIADWWLKR